MKEYSKPIIATNELPNRIQVAASKNRHYAN